MNAHENNDTVGQLVRLSQIEYATEEGQPDLMGWPVADNSGEVVGRVSDLLVDTETGEIPFASLCYGDKCTAVPLELMFLDEAAKRLVLPVDNQNLANAPEFTEETEDLQPYIDFWDDLVSDWQDEMSGEEE